MKHRSFLITSILLLVVGAFSSVIPQEKTNALMVYGEGFIFGVLEPENWTGDTKNAARYQANVIFYRKGRAAKYQSAIIRVRINKKANEKTEEDLAYDMAGYRDRYPQIQFKEIDATHGKYRCFAKLFFVEDDFYEYVAYLNPGEAYWYSFSVALTTQKRQADEAELAAFRSVISSLLAISGSSNPVAAPEQDPSKYTTALKAAEDNISSKEGKRYDEDFGRNLAPSLAQTMMMCTKDIAASMGVAPFVILVRVGPLGEAEDILVHPETPVALCVKAKISLTGHPKPPGPSWWVKIDVTVSLKDASIGGFQEPGRIVVELRYSHPYSHWSMFRPASSVKYRYSRRTADGLLELDTAFTLTEVTPEYVRLECLRSIISNAVPPAASNAGSIQLEFREADDEFQGWDLHGGRLGYSVFRALRNPDAKIIEESREEMIITGTPLPTRKRSIRVRSNGSSTTLTVWLSDDIPGKIVKYVRELSGSIDVREEAVATEYRSFKAEKAEIERLISSRKPSQLDVPAWDYMTVRLGFVDDYGVAFRGFTEARRDIGNSFLEYLNANPAQLKKSLSLARSTLKGLAERQDQDIRHVEKEIGPTEFAKLRPIAREAKRFASLLIREADLSIAIAGAVAHFDPAYIASLKVRSDRVREETKQALQKFQDELKQIKDARIKFLR